VHDQLTCASFHTARRATIVYPVGPGTRWYCAATLPQAENRAVLNLRALGFNVYLPQFVKKVQRARAPWKTEHRVVPLFPAYLFLSFDVELDPWEEAATCAGVRRLFGCTPLTPTPVEHGAVERIMSEPVIEPDPTARPLPIPVGSLVRTVAGPLSDLNLLCTWSTEERVGTMMTLFGRATPLTLERSQVYLVA